MKLPVKADEWRLEDADSVLVADAFHSGFPEEAQDAEHMRQIAAAVNNHAALVKALEAIITAADEELVCHCGDYVRDHRGMFGGCGRAVPMYQPAKIDYSLIEQAERALAVAKGEADASN